MKKILLVGILTVMFPLTLFAQSVSTSTPATATSPAPVVAPANPGLLPGDFFYFLDNWGEAIRTFFTFDPIAKAKLHLEYAKERAVEISAVLADSARKVADVAGAEQNLAQQVADAAAIIKSEQAKGINVSSLATELRDQLDSTHLEVKDALAQHAERADQAQQQIQAKIASLSPTDPQVAGLTQALASVTKEKNQTAEESNAISSELSDEQAAFDEAMGPQAAAEKNIEQAMRLREILGNAGGSSGLPVGLTTSTAALMNQAQEAILRGDFESAKNISEQAKNLMEQNQESLRTRNEINGGDSLPGGSKEGGQTMETSSSTHAVGEAREVPEVPESQQRTSTDGRNGTDN